MPEGILQATAGGSSIQILDETGDVSVFGVHSFFTYAPQHSHIGNNMDVSCTTVGDSAGVVGKVTALMKTAWSLPDMTDMFPLEVLMVGGNYMSQQTNRTFHRTLNTMEFVAGVAMGHRTPLYDLWVDTSGTMAFGAALTISGPRAAGFVGSGAAALDSLTPLPLFNVRATDVNFLFDAAWTVTGTSLNAVFTLNTFALLAGTSVTFVVGGTTITVVDGNVSVVSESVSIIAPEVSITGLVTVLGDVIANGVSLSTHIHPGVQTGPEVTGPPVL